MRQSHETGSYRLPRVEHARVRDAMHTGVITCDAEMPLQEVARTMADRHVHCVVVTPAAGSAAGWRMLRALDVVRAGAGAFAERCAGDIGTGRLVTVSTDDTLSDAARLMTDNQTEHLIVVDADDGSPAGVLSSLDVAGVMGWGEA